MSGDQIVTDEDIIAGRVEHLHEALRPRNLLRELVTKN